LVGIGIAAFVSSNIDDLFILMIFFATLRLPSVQIILGQYIGMGSLMGISLVGSLISLIVPRNIIGLIGLFPIAIGIKELLELHNKGDKEEDEELTKKLPRNKIQLPFLTVAAVTFSGGEEIGVYTSLFATNNEVEAIITLISVTMVLTAFWCFLALYLVKHSLLADIFRSVGSRVLPYVLIGLGLYILAKAFLMV
ncbi:MAG TPA: cadmium resistance transporter, partial [Nitrososphaeraceae archaeon]